MRKAVLAAAMAAFLGASGPVLASGIPVFDATRAADFIVPLTSSSNSLA